MNTWTEQCLNSQRTFSTQEILLHELQLQNISMLHPKVVIRLKSEAVKKIMKRLQDF